MKVLKVVPFLCLAMLAWGVTSANAAAFKADAYTAQIQGAQGGEHALPPPAGTGGGGGGSEPVATLFGFEGSLMTSCNKVVFSGQLTEASSSLSTTQEMSSCASFGFTSATVSMNGCGFVFNAGTGSKDEFTGTMDIGCPEGKKIVIAASNCEIQIGSQTGVGPIYYVNLTKESPKPAMTIGFNVSNLAYTKTQDGFLCPLSGTGAMSSGVIAGGATIVGTAGGLPTGIWIE